MTRAVNQDELRAALQLLFDLELVDGADGPGTFALTAAGRDAFAAHIREQQWRLEVPVIICIETEKSRRSPSQEEISALLAKEMERRCTSDGSASGSAYLVREEEIEEHNAVVLGEDDGISFVEEDT